MNLRAKVTRDTAVATRYWDAAGTRMRFFESHEGLHLNVKIMLRSLWIANDAWGLVCILELAQHGSTQLCCFIFTL